MFRLLLVILVALTIPPPGSELQDSVRKQTLSEQDYMMAKTSDANFPDDAQILYCEYKGTPAFNCGVARNLQIYGDGRVLAMHDIHNKSQKEISFFLSVQPNQLNDLAEELASQGFFQMRTEGYAFMSLPSSEIHSYYITLRIRDKYYTLHFSGFVGEDPSWLPLTELFRTLLDQVMIEDNKITGTQYLKAREEIISKYGFHMMCGDSSVQKYVEKTECQ